MKILELFKDNILRINILKTIYFNFRALPLRQAIKFPVFVGYNVKLRNIGNIKIEGDIKPAKVSLGVIRNPWETNDKTLILSNMGTITFKGKVKIHPGAVIATLRENSSLSFGNKVTIGARSLVICAKSIQIGDYSGCSWDCQIIDTDFHFMIDLVNNKPLRRTQKIVMGNYVFVGNHCNIAKGANLPDHCVISSHSDVRGSFKKAGNNILIGGCPAKVLDHDYAITYKYSEEQKYAQMLENN